MESGPNTDPEHGSSQLLELTEDNDVELTSLSTSNEACENLRISRLPQSQSSSTSESHVLQFGIATDSPTPALSEIPQKVVDEVIQPRSRRKKHPFSPEPIMSVRRSSPKTKVLKSRIPQDLRNSVGDESQSNSFSCDRCGALSVINPSRSRLPQGQLKKIQTMRKKFDPVSRKILHLCNACGLSFSRPKKQKIETVPIEDRDKYLGEAQSFAKSLAETLGRPAAERLYCPAFKNRPCGCIQTYITLEGDDGTLESKVGSLLQFFNTACELNRRKNLFPEYQISQVKSKDDMNSNSIERKQRQREYEHFVLETRQILREKLHLCERACQRILLYSNNFLHKRWKSAPDQNPRIPKQLGRNSTGQLKSIDELSTISCCSGNCSRLAVTHSTLLEDWRKQAALGQRQARRVLAEMLTPSGGTKANCYKFITMVTGCGPTTISSVSHQMRITKGNREPPEHGLKKWFRDNPRKQNKSSVVQFGKSNQQSKEATDLTHSILGVHSENTNLVNQIQEQNPKAQLEQKKLELEEAKRQLYLKQQELECCQQMMNHHFQEQSLQTDDSNAYPTWKVNEGESLLKVADSGTGLLNLPVESGSTVMSELSNGQIVELVDLVPGTYIVVPSSFDSSTVLAMASNTKESATLSCLHAQDQPDIVCTDNLHTLPISCQTNSDIVYSHDLQSLSSSSKTNQYVIQSENCAQTIFNISPTTEAVNTFLEEVQSHIQPMEIEHSEDFISGPSVCTGDEFSNSEEHGHSTAVPVISPQPHSLCIDTNATTLSAHGLGNASYLTSCQTSVMTLPCDSDMGRVVSNQGSDTSLPPPKRSSMFHDEKTDDCIGSFNVTTSLDTVPLLTSHQAPSTENAFQSFDRLFE